MRTKLLTLILGFVIIGPVAIAQPVDPAGRQRGFGPMLQRELKLTETQRSQVQKIRFGIMKQQIDLRAQIAQDRVDYAELASAENPDQNQLSAKIQDISKLKGQLHSNMLNAWFAVNKLLTPEQQKVWKRVLEHPMMFSRGSRMHPMMHRQNGMMMKRGTMMGQGSMMMNGNGTMGRPMWDNNQNAPDPSR